MASNVSAGTRGLSAGDWVRLKRLKGATNYLSNQTKDVINPPAGTSCVFTNFGTSKIRRPASFWVNYRESQVADYVLESQDIEKQGVNKNGKILTATRVCSSSPSCSTSSAVKEGNVYCN